MKDINFNTQQIRYFRIAMKCSSFSEAAKMAYTTQSNISKNIAGLEDELSTKLFIRSKKGILPTQEAILLNAELQDSEERLSKILNRSSDLPDSLRIGFCRSINFANAIPEFFDLLHDNETLKKAPTTFYCKDAEQIIRDVTNRDTDIGFILGEMQISNLEIKIQRIVFGNLKLFFSENSGLAKIKDLSVADFENYPLVTTRWLVENNSYKMIDALPFNPKNIVIVESYDDLVLYLATGDYFTLLRPFVNLAYQSDIKSFDIPNYHFEQGIAVIWNKNNDSRYLKKIINDLKSRQ